MKTEDAIKSRGGVAELAKFLGVSRQTVWYWKRKGELPELWAMKYAHLLAGGDKTRPVVPGRKPGLPKSNGRA